MSTSTSSPSPVLIITVAFLAPSSLGASTLGASTLGASSLAAPSAKDSPIYLKVSDILIYFN